MKNKKLKSQDYKILFICSSNVCRSPYCEYMFRRMISESPVLKDRVTVKSSAVFNLMFKINKKTRQVLVEHEGFDETYVDSHKPGYMPFELKKYDEADVIIGMTRSHKFMLLPKYRAKFKTLSEVAVDKYEAIPDPWLENDMDKYYDAMETLKKYLVIYLERLEANLA